MLLRNHALSVGATAERERSTGPEARTPGARLEVARCWGPGGGRVYNHNHNHNHNVQRKLLHARPLALRALWLCALGLVARAGPVCADLFRLVIWCARLTSTPPKFATSVSVATLPAVPSKGVLSNGSVINSARV